MTSSTFFIPGRPRATQTGSIVRAGGRAFPVRRNTPWSAVCGLVARAHAPRSLPAGPLAVTLTFCLPAPKGKHRALPNVRPDIDGLAKGLLDAWNGVLWIDDGQIVELHLRKVYDVAPGVRVSVECIGGE